MALENNNFLPDTSALDLHLPAYETPVSIYKIGHVDYVGRFLALLKSFIFNNYQPTL